MRRPIQTLSACLLTLSLGSPWALLQTAAWTGMVINYSQHASLHEAISRTFDGKHPCALCKAIQKGKADEQKRDGQKLSSSQRLDLAVIWQKTEFFFGTTPQLIRVTDLIICPRTEEPPKPPPRPA